MAFKALIRKTGTRTRPGKPRAKKGSDMATPRKARPLVACEWCRADFEQRNSRRRFCSARCRAAAWQARHVRMPAAEGRALRGLLKDTVQRVSAIQRDAGVMLDRLWEAKAALDRYVGG